MNIKIQPGSTIQDISRIDENTESKLESNDGVTSATSATADPITRIATELVEGRMNTTQAVDALIEQTLSMDMIAKAPPSLRKEIEAILRSAIETDPHLIALTQALE